MVQFSRLVMITHEDVCCLAYLIIEDAVCECVVPEPFRFEENSLECFLLLAADVALAYLQVEDAAYGVCSSFLCGLERACDFCVLRFTDAFG